MSVKRLKGRLLVFIGDAKLVRPINDPYIRLKVGRHVRKTAFFHGSSAGPQWNEELNFGYLDEATAAMKIEMREHAFIGKGKRLASLWLPLNPAPVGRIDVTLTLKGEDMGKLTLEVKLEDDRTVLPRSASVTKERPGAAQESFGGDRSALQNSQVVPMMNFSGTGGNGSISSNNANNNASSSLATRLSPGRASAPVPLNSSVSPVRSHSPPSAGAPALSASAPQPSLAAASTITTTTTTTSSPPAEAAAPQHPASASPAAAPVATAGTSQATQASSALAKNCELCAAGSDTLAWILDHKWMATPALVVFLILLSLISVFVIVRFLLLERMLEQTLQDVIVHMHPSG